MKKLVIMININIRQLLTCFFHDHLYVFMPIVATSSALSTMMKRILENRGLAKNVVYTETLDR